MTLDEALRQIAASRQCWLTWRTDTGEPHQVVGFDGPPTPVELTECLARMQRDFGGIPTAGRFLESARGTRAVLEEHVQAASDRGQRVIWYNRIEREPFERLVEILERRSYPEVVGEFSGASHVVALL